MNGFAPPTLTTLTEAVALNVGVMRAHTEAAVMAVVKADGYGHGALPVARAALTAGATWLGTTALEEAVQLRDAGLEAPILTWLNPAGVDAASASAHRIDVAVGSPEELGELLAAAPNGGSSPVRVHLHLDVGMAREGCPRHEWDRLIRLASRAQERGRIAVVGLMGHLPLADQADPAINRAAVQQFGDARSLLQQQGLDRGVLAHLAATAGALADSQTHHDLVRFGAGLVGIDPSERTVLHGASRLTAPIVHTARAEAGTSVGYGGTYRVGEHRAGAGGTHLSVVPLGYADGIPRELRAVRGTAPGVQIDGERYPVVGRVSMDQIVVETGDRAFPRGTTVTVFGPDGGAPSIQDWARWAGTIPHTIVTGIGPRVRRTFQ